jgi:hypothetical protein
MPNELHSPFHDHPRWLRDAGVYHAMSREANHGEIATVAWAYRKSWSLSRPAAYRDDARQTTTSREQSCIYIDRRCVQYKAVDSWTSVTDGHDICNKTDMKLVQHKRSQIINNRYTNNTSILSAISLLLVCSEYTQHGFNVRPLSDRWVSLTIGTYRETAGGHSHRSRL